MKRLFDFITSLTGLIVLFPIFIIVALLVKISSEGPVFFVQKRIGKNGKVFQMIKFRSMAVIQSSDSTRVASLKYYDEEDILASQDNPLKFNDEVIYPDKVRLNLDYYYNNNLWIDIKIIFATIFRVNY